MKASRAAIRTAKAVITVEERLTAVESQASQIYALQMKIYGALEKLMTMLSADKPDRTEPDRNVPKAKTVRKRGGA